MSRINRRDLLRAAAATPLLLTPVAVKGVDRESTRKKLPIAAVVTAYRENSHADVVIGKILEGFDQKGGKGPNLRVVSMYTDQLPAGDMSRDLAKKHGFAITKTIDEAITLGTNKVQVAGVLSIGEHGNYPYTKETNQHMYPRRRFFNGIVAAFKRCGHVVPVFNDKHLSYRWEDAKHMFDTSREMKFPMMAGSSLPVAWREPAESLPLNSEIEDALVVGYGGLESYGFHALETLQCVIERRRGGETGVKTVQAVREDQIWKAERDGRWSRELLDSALKTIPDVPKGDLKTRLTKGAAFYLIEHSDGFQSTVAMANGVARHFAIAVKLLGRREPFAQWFRLEDAKPYGHFTYLVKAIESMIHTGKPSYPVERTLLTTGVLDRVMHSLANNGKRLATHELAVRYKAVDWPFANHAT